MQSKEPAKLISRKVEYQGFRKLETVVIQPRDLNTGKFGAPMSREFIEMAPAVVGIPYIPETDQIVLNQQFRVGMFMTGEENPYRLECSSGIIDEGETPKDAVKREVMEETGCAVTEVEYLGKAYPSPANSGEIYYLYCCRISQAEAAMYGEAHEGEEIKTHIVDVITAIDMMDRGEILNGASILALNWFIRNHGRIRKKWIG